ncbi:glycerate kinase [Nocardioides panacisoli]|uniref:glycerate kinase n=1 Tax=Nocardioides panacisoli TaxID=627624 RepID=UPI001C63AC54|nr:glycerate kinase [Nocardioides panacisoli]QYJ02753.1 glycerate kinase [Nocardioides panacisoli]
MSSPRVVVAPDKFKGSATAVEVADAVGRGVVTERPDAEVARVPIADGGDGTLAAAVAAGFHLVPVTVSGPTGHPVRTAYARRGDTAVVEMADACGLARLPSGVPAPREASSRGLGEVLAAALDASCTEIVLGIGGSASTDGGAGMLCALGARILGRDGEPLGEGGAVLESVAALDLTGLHPRLAEASTVVACDVDNPLTGPGGAAAVYGPQKGADDTTVAVLDAGLQRWADGVATAVGFDVRNMPGAGAAGGVGFAALAVLDAVLRPGIDLVLDLAGFDEQVAGSDLVITGEGSLDAQSLRGKAPVGVAARAAEHGARTIAVCGRRDLSDDDLRAGGIHGALALLDLEADVERCLRAPLPLLEQLGREIARRHM